MTWHLRNIFAGEGGSSGIKSHLQDHRQERIYTPDGSILGLFRFDWNGIRRLDFGVHAHWKTCRDELGL